MLDLLIRNADVVDPVNGVYRADIGIKGGKIAAILTPDAPADAIAEYDAAGKHIFPGCIDPHTHMGFKHDFGDDVRTESGSAAIGGVTTFMSFHRHYKSAEPKPYDDIPDLIETINRQSHIDMGLHLGMLTETQVGELDKYIERGVSSFKFYMAYRGADGKTVGMINECDDGILFEGFETLGRHPHAVACVHCENTEIIGRRAKAVKAEGRDGLAAWNAARPAFAEAEHVRRSAYFAELAQCNLYFVHIGGEPGLEEAVAHMDRYDRLTIETCPHYLLLNEESEVGALAKVSPPIRRQIDQERVWRGLIDGEISTVGSDHCATSRDQKSGGIWKAAAGFPGMATILPAILSEGVRKRGMSLQRAAQVTSYNAARAFNLAPRKGAIQIGGDADLAIVDLELSKVVDHKILGSVSDFSPYEGQTLTGWPVATILRGKVVARDGQLVGTPGDGEFIGR